MLARRTSRQYRLTSCAAFTSSLTRISTIPLARRTGSRKMATVKDSIPHIVRTAHEPRQQGMWTATLSKIEQVNSTIRLLRLSLPKDGVCSQSSREVMSHIHRRITERSPIRDLHIHHHCLRLPTDPPHRPRSATSQANTSTYTSPTSPPSAASQSPPHPKPPPRQPPTSNSQSKTPPPTLPPSISGATPPPSCIVPSLSRSVASSPSHP